MFELIKKIFIGLLTGIGSQSNHTKCASLSNKKCVIQPTLINLYPNEYSQEFHYYPFMVKLNRCAGSCNSLKDLNLSLINHLPYSFKCAFDGRKCNSDQWWNNNKCKNVMYVEKIIFGILPHVIVKMENILQVLWMIQGLRVMKLYNKMMKTRTRKLIQTTKQKLFQQILMKIK